MKSLHRLLATAYPFAIYTFVHVYRKGQVEIFPDYEGPLLTRDAAQSEIMGKNSVSPESKGGW